MVKKHQKHHFIPFSCTGSVHPDSTEKSASDLWVINRIILLTYVFVFNFLGGKIVLFSLFSSTCAVIKCIFTVNVTLFLIKNKVLLSNMFCLLKEGKSKKAMWFSGLYSGKPRVLVYMWVTLTCCTCLNIVPDHLHPVNSIPWLQRPLSAGSCALSHCRICSWVV